MHQILLHMPEEGRAPIEHKPDRVWLLVPEARGASLPLRLVHGGNAWVAEPGVDWKWRGGNLRYSGRRAGQPCILVLEYHLAPEDKLVQPWRKVVRNLSGGRGSRDGETWVLELECGHGKRISKGRGIPERVRCKVCQREPKK